MLARKMMKKKKDDAPAEGSGTGDPACKRLGSPQDPDAKPPSRPSHYSRPPASLLSQTDPIGVGQNFGSRYHIIRLLGVGGMGSVYQAWDQVLEVAVAIKVIRPDFTTEPIV